MGLEIAEFMMNLEDSFDIRFDDSSPFDPGIDVTVSMIVDYVEPKIREKETAEIMAVEYPQKVFEQTAVTFAQYAEVPLETVTQDTRLTDLFVDAKRWRKMWRVQDGKINEMSMVLINRCLNFDKFFRKARMILVCWGLSVMFFVPWLCWFITREKTVVIVGTIAYFVLSGFWVWYFGWNLPDIFNRFPPHGLTVGQFAEAITAHRRRFLTPDGSPMTRSTLELRVIEILATMMGMNPNDIMLTDRLVQDLKMG